MGTFLGYYGDMTIPETRREEFSRRVLTILDQGGMMELEEVCMFGKKICLLKPLHIQQDKPAAWIYNYFENDFWEDAGYWPETCRFCTNKVGWRQFNRVCSAVYVLYEFYTGSFGIANQDDSVYDGRRIIGWLNHLFQEQYANDRVRDPWRIYQLLPEYRRDDDLLALIPSGNSMDVIGAVTYLVAAGRDEWREWRKEQSPDHSPADGFSLFDCITAAETILAELKKSGDGDEAQKLEMLKTVLKSEKPGYRQEELPDHYRAFSLTASMLPMEITAKLLANAFSGDFQAILEELLPFAADVRALWGFDDLLFSKAVPPVDTASFLGCTDDDRAWWRRTGSDVHFSGEMNAWLAQLREELAELSASGELLQGMEAIRLLIDTLYAVGRKYRHVFAFREMFYDFAACAESPSVQAAIQLLARMAERYQDDPGGAEKLRRYLAVLGNLELRKAELGF